MTSRLRTDYTATIDSCSATIESLRRKINLYGTIRLLLVVALVTAFVLWSDKGWVFMSLVSLALVVPFVVLMVTHGRLSRRRDYFEAMRTLCENELKGLDYDFSAFDGAPTEADAEHSFSFDLDIFGEKSLFQSINRTVIDGGRARLAGWFKSPLTDKSQILQRQQVVGELSAKTALRQHFYVTGILSEKHKSDRSILESLTGGAAVFRKSRSLEVAVWLIPVLWVVLLVLYAADVVGLGYLSAFFIISLAAANSKVGQVAKLHGKVNKMDAILGTYARLMEIVESAQLSSGLFGDIQSRLTSGTMPASQAIKQLSARLHALDQRANMFMAILNIFIMWDIRSALKIVRWQEQHLQSVGRWLDALDEFDALSSLAGFGYNHPEYIYPEIADSYFSMSGRALGHPLMNRDSCVRNDIDIDRNPYFMIITGANMAGKSTYLRTVGVNFVLGCVGAPVCAEQLTLFACSLATSLRTSDSLPDNESYFFAELKRLKMIIDRLKAGERLFIILDEILKGTNSADKQKGSLALVRQLVSFDACGIIATHDLLLGKLHDEFPGYVRNYRFEADIVGERLSFAYKLRDGVAENMNACFLMRKMGITV